MIRKEVKEFFVQVWGSPFDPIRVDAVNSRQAAELATKWGFVGPHATVLVWRVGRDVGTAAYYYINEEGYAE